MARIPATVRMLLNLATQFVLKWLHKVAQVFLLLAGRFIGLTIKTI